MCALPRTWFRCIAPNNEIDRPTMPAESPEGLGNAGSDGADRRQRQRLVREIGAVRVTWPPSQTYALLVEREIGIEFRIGERPIFRDAVIGEDAEILRPETGRMGRPVDRAAADTIADHWLYRRAIVFDRVVRGAAPQIGIGILRPLGQARPRCRVTRHLPVVEPVTTLDADNAQPGGRQSPCRCRTGWPRPDHSDVEIEFTVHRILIQCPWICFVSLVRLKLGIVGFLRTTTP